MHTHLVTEIGNIRRMHTSVSHTSVLATMQNKLFPVNVHERTSEDYHKSTTTQRSTEPSRRQTSRMMLDLSAAAFLLEASDSCTSGHALGVLVFDDDTEVGSRRDTDLSVPVDMSLALGISGGLADHPS